MNVYRNIMIAAAVVAGGANIAYAADGQDNARIQRSIYDVIRNDQRASGLLEGRASVAPQAVREQASQDPFYFRQATRPNRN